MYHMTFGSYFHISYYCIYIYISIHICYMGTSIFFYQRRNHRGGVDNRSINRERSFHEVGPVSSSSRRVLCGHDGSGYGRRAIQADKST